MSNKPRFPPKADRTPRTPERTILFAVFPQFQILDLTGPMAAFEIAARFRPGSYKLRVASSAGGMISSSAALAAPTETLKGLNLARIDTMIVVGGQGTRQAMEDKALCTSLVRGHERARRVASVCSGSFVLAAAGLLEGKRATTHWRRAAQLQKLYPGIQVEPDRIFVRDGAIWSSAGVTAGIDLALAMIAEDLGPDTAKDVAREMVVYAQRPGGQTQHSALLDLDQPDGRFAALNAFIRVHLNEDLSVTRLAEQACMSERNFARAYAQETGMTPAKAVERFRLEAARAALESGANSIQTIAMDTGFGDPERMRRAFIRLYGAPPASMRRTLRHT